MTTEQTLIMVGLIALGALMGWVAQILIIHRVKKDTDRALREQDEARRRMEEILREYGEVDRDAR